MADIGHAREHERRIMRTFTRGPRRYMFHPAPAGGRAFDYIQWFYGPLMSARSYIGSVRVALLDDHALVLKGLIAHLEKTPSIVIVGSHTSSRPFRAMLAAMPVDVALIDYSLAMDDIDGIALINLLRASYPRMKILVVSAHAQELVVHNMRLAGADGFVAKSQDPDDVIRAIDAVMTGREFVPVREAVDGTPPKDLVPLSPRERDVIRQLLEGLTVGQIAARTGRSLKTISTQKSCAYRKLRITSDNELFLLRDYVLALDAGSP
ncbi:response regulator transcription factor [Luteibacter sp. 3190]|uniref:response regulator transcription factor n=2 Tax=unclassified Luteibacter TaxID=2620188 RepID=UPI0008CA17CA|nr:response regulator transcription factor [Luteibacter sp. 3190]MDR6935581.1 DNA-binding NarL/FixJ family response regulator [Luteibacter sp. 3190]SEO95328.1 regulatory protein, luxR family [Luteibacter sp. UNC138MFCol5.1]